VSPGERGGKGLHTTIVSREQIFVNCSLIGAHGLFF
jgi:hypothetical protein